MLEAVCCLDDDKGWAGLVIRSCALSRRYTELSDTKYFLVSVKCTASSRGDISDDEHLHDRVETERFKPFAYDDLVARDKASLDLFWLKDESLEDTDNLPAPDVLAAEIVENLEAALEQFRSISEALEAEA